MRLELALQQGLEAPATSLLFHPEPDLAIENLGDISVVHPWAKQNQTWGGRGVSCKPIWDGRRAALAYVQVTRSKAQTLDLIAQAAEAADIVVVDGQKTDGIDSHFKAVRKRADVAGNITKAHGRIFWFASCDLSDWKAAPIQVDGLATQAGVFSALGVDPASAALLAALPEKLPPRVADFGAGWGYLSADLVQREGVKVVSLVEADHTALACAKQNVTDPKAEFFWQDVLDHMGTYGAVIMNPPFHQGRDGVPALGQGFIKTAARCLTKTGQLWMVANRHLPYEATLAQTFSTVEELPGPKGFKIFHATRPKR